MRQPAGMAQKDVLGRAGEQRAAQYLRDEGYEILDRNWRCRAGGRYLYVCENGLVHYCSQQRGYPATPLAEYTTADVKREFLTEKGCAPNCTISCVHQVSYIDHWRAPQSNSVTPPTAHNGHGELVPIQ